MLSKNAIFILGIIASGSINPYAVNKVINRKRPNLRNKMPTPTIYGIIKMLRKQKYIVGKKSKSGNMPDRTVYSITARGDEVLKKTLNFYLNTPEETLSDLAMTIFLMRHLTRSEVLRGLNAHRDKLEIEIATLKRMITQDKKRGIDAAYVIAINHILKIVKLNLKTVGQLIAAIEADERWVPGPMPFWRDQLLSGKSNKD